MSEKTYRCCGGGIKLILSILFCCLLFSNIVEAQRPVISSVSPNKATPTTTVNISGANFSTTPAQNIVYFGTKKGIVTGSTASSLSVKVDTGSGYAPVSVLNMDDHLTGTEDSFFTPTYINNYFINGGINFKPRIDLNTGLKPYMAAIGDIDGDGKLDLVVNNKGSGTDGNTIYIYRNISTRGTIDATSFAIPDTFSTGSQPISVRIADLDADGKQDIIVSDIGVSRVSVFHNTSSPGVISLDPEVEFPILPSTGAYVLGIADFDSDGHLDIAVSCELSNTVVILRNTGIIDSITTASFESPVAFNVTGGPVGLSVADLDMDGRPDIVTADTTGYTISILRNTSTSGALSFASYFNLATQNEPVDVQMGDLDGDGKPDIVVSNNQSNSLSVFRNISSAGSLSATSFAGRVDIPTVYPSFPTAIALSDIDGDGKTDIVLTNVSAISNSMSIFRNNATPGSISAGSFVRSATYYTGQFPFGATVGDLDGDGYPDIVTGNNVSATISIFRNYPLPAVAPITGDTSLCFSGAGSSTQLADATAGGTWLLSNTAIASISSTGLLTASAQGYDTVSYRVIAGGDTNYAYRVVRIDTSAWVSAISGGPSLCVGGHITLTDTAVGGTWSTTGSIFVASLNVSTGFMIGNGAGNITVKYKKVTNCNADSTTTVITVYPSTISAGVITGTSGIMCSGTAQTLSESVTGGVWSTITGNASVSATGVVSAISVGPDTVKYTVSSPCATAVAIYPLAIGVPPHAGNITGPGGVCTGGTISLSDTATGGSWTATNNNASVNASGVVTPNAVGGDTILYIVTTSCASDTARKVIGVVDAGSSLPIAGPSIVCVGQTITLTNPAADGTWTTSNAGVAAIDPSTGVVTGTGTGTDTVTYSVSYSCGPEVSTYVISVTNPPNAGTITGMGVLCPGTSLSLFDAAGTGTWSSNNSAVASVSAAGVVTGHLSDTTSIIFTVTSGCGSVHTSALATVGIVPHAGVITGNTSICGLTTSALSDTAAGGSWISTNIAVASVSSAGLVSATGYGTDTIRYRVVTSCGTADTFVVITVTPIPGAGTISGPATLCAGIAASYSETGSAGTWSTSSAALATVTPTGAVTGHNPGTVTLFYSTSNSCGAAIDSAHAVVTLQPHAGVITGNSQLCGLTTSLLSDTATGGVWSSVNTGIATVNTSGLVTGTGFGTDTIKYHVGNTCGSADTFTVITVTVLPVSGVINGPATICPGIATTFSETGSGGIWGTGSPSIASVSATGIVTGHNAGSTMLHFALTNSCGSINDSAQVTVTALPEAGTITGNTQICGLSTSALNDTAAGGTWTSTSTGIATVNSAGFVTAHSYGIDTIRYTTSNNCGSADTFVILQVLIQPTHGTLSGAASVCTGSSVTFTETNTGGNWSSSAGAIATVSATGVVTGHIAGTAYIHYIETNNCGTSNDSALITVNTAPAAATISGPLAVCTGDSITLSASDTGGTWTSSDGLTATVNATGVVHGVNAGLVNISYTTVATCGSATATAPVTVNLTPHAGTITGPSIVCTATPATLTDTASGGIWTATNGDATVSGGIVAGATAGTDTILYVVTNACGSDTTTHTVTITVTPVTAGITGGDTVCSGATLPLADATAGGIWTISGAGTIASVTTTGVVTGIAAGQAIVTYTVSNGSCTASAYDTITVRTTPTFTSTLTPAAICDNVPFTYAPSSSTAGATFTWSRAAVTGISAAAASGSGSVNETLADTTALPQTVTYVYVAHANGCSNTQNVAVTVNPIPSLLGSLSESLCGGTQFLYTALSATPGASFTWTRPQVNGITPDSSSGVGSISETLSNTSGGAITVIYIFNVSANGCSQQQQLAVTLASQPPAPVIAVRSPSFVCDNVMYQNFGAATPPPTDVTYKWSTVNNSAIWATGSTKQYCLINFDHPGIAWVYLTATTATSTCISRDSVAISVGAGEADMPAVDRFGDAFFCEQNYYDTYQWGYDDAATLDSTILTGETAQNYLNSTPDLAGKYYWVIITHAGCMQKAYYNGPVSVQQVVAVPAEATVTPNPNKGTFMLTLPSASGKDAQVTITNTLGRKVKTLTAATNRAVEVQLSVPAGIYYLSAITGAEHYTARIVVTE